MPGQWSGSFSNELVTATPYQAVAGIRAIIDMDSLGDVVINAPPPLDHSSFSMWFKNNNRNLLTINATGGGVDIQNLEGGVLTSVSTRIRHGVVGFTHLAGEWELADFIPFEVPEGLHAGITWTPQSVNGLCAIVDRYRMLTVERTAQGRYVITTDGAATISHHLLTPVCRCKSLGANRHPQLTVDGWTATTIDLMIGFRNPGGVFQLDDLDGHVDNTVSVKVTEFP